MISDWLSKCVYPFWDSVVGHDPLAHLLAVLALAFVISIPLQLLISFNAWIQGRIDAESRRAFARGVKVGRDEDAYQRWMASREEQP